MGRPQFVPTDEQRRLVEMMAGLGSTQDKIARKLKIAPKTLRSSFRDELDNGAVDADLAVMNTLYKMATSGKCPAATIFWLKTRMGLREHADPAPEAKPPEFHLHVEERAA